MCWGGVGWGGVSLWSGWVGEMGRVGWAMWASLKINIKW